MKQILVFLGACLISISSFAQPHYSASIDFENNSQLIEFDTTQTNNLWQIGIPMKSLFNSAYSMPFAIITDTVDHYQTNNFSSFQVKIIPPPGSCWGTGFMEFYHKYDFELNKDGGFIEVKYDDDTNWTNIILDTDPEVYINGYNFYTVADTITGGIPAFTGTANDWIFAQFEWAWQIGVKSSFHDSLTIRFSIKSDSVETNQEGWLIDNLNLVLYDCTSGIESLKTKTYTSKVFPNPVIEKSEICFTNELNTLTVVNVFNNAGVKVKSVETRSDKIEILNKEFAKGVFVYHIIQNNETVGNGKFVIAK
jgi:hypothetical protein